MKKTLKNFILASLALSIFLSQPIVSYAQSADNTSTVNISSYIYEPTTDWYSERFTDGFLNIELMMKNGFTRYEALEVQNQMRDMLNANPTFKELEINDKGKELFVTKDKLVLDTLEKAIQNVKDKKIFENPVPKQLKGDEFYVAFDLDETLLSHYYDASSKGGKYYDYTLTKHDHILKPVVLSPNYIKLTPNWEKALKDISKIPNCKGIYLFTAKDDVSANEIADIVKIDGKPLRSFVKGVLTRNYLSREDSPTKNSKDLRMIDETLKHVILVDDNPARIFENQQENLKEFPKFNIDAYYEAKKTNNKKVIDYFEKLMPRMVDEIKEAAEYARKNKNVSFVDAYYPYSMKGNAEVLMLVGQGYSLKSAEEFVRKNTKAFDAPFFYIESKNF